MEPQTQPHPASLKVMDFAEWATNTTECTEISLGKTYLPKVNSTRLNLYPLVEPSVGDGEQPTKSITFNPEFTYPIFGDHETAFGYKDLEVKVTVTT